MADKKISALTAATTPLGGTEVLPIVQGGSTVKVSIANVTAGRDINTKNVIATGQGVFGGPLDNFWSASGALYGYYSGGGVFGSYSDASGTLAQLSFDGSIVALRTANVSRLEVSNAGNVTVKTGDLVIGTAGKGIDFSAATHSAGMTSELLNDYEEGTWTPNQGGGLTVVGSFGSSGKYTKIGRQVTVTGTVTGSTSIAINAGSNICTNLPFTVSGGAGGVCVNDGINASSVIQVYSTTVTSTGAIGATAGLYFTATFFV